MSSPVGDRRERSDVVLNKVLSDSGKRLNDGVSFHPLWVTVEKEATKD